MGIYFGYTTILHELYPKGVTDYIEGHPECTKQKVVNALNEAGKLSRVPTLRTIKELEQQHIIKVRKKKANSQTHYLRINDDSLILLVIKRTEGIKKAFLTLLDEVRLMSNVLQSEHENEDWWYIEKGLVDVDVSIEILLRHFVSIYTLHALFTWPQKVSSKESLHRLNEIVFNNIQEIQSKFFEFNLDKEIAKGNIVSYSWVLTSKKLKKVFDDFKFEFAGLDKKAEPLLDLLWRAGSDFLPYVVYEGIDAFLSGESPRKRMILTIADEIKNDGRKMLKNTNYRDLIDSRH
jgi:hypothetical protein